MREQNVPTEAVEQTRLLQWARMSSGAHPELAMLYHIPNEGKRSAALGARMRDAGLKSGVPDLCLPVARGGKHGLYIELKRMRGGKVSEAQAGWIDALNAQGYAAMVCRGWEEAAEEIRRYLQGERRAKS